MLNKAGVIKMNRLYESPEFETIETMQTYCLELNASSDKLGDIEGAGNEDFIE